MQYIYTEFKLPSNGKFYDTNVVHLRPKTIFDIKMLLNNPVYMLKAEIDALQNCIDPKDNINVYDLVNQDVVYLLYMLRSLSSNFIDLKVKDTVHTIKISELVVNYLENWDNKIKLNDSGLEVTIAYQPIKNIFNIEEQKKEFLNKYPEYKGDVLNTVALLNAIDSIDNSVSKDHIRNTLETLSWKDSLQLLSRIEELNKLDFGIKEEIELNIDGKDTVIPLQITEEFFRPTL